MVFGIVLGASKTMRRGGYCTIMGGGACVAYGGTLPWEEMDPIIPFVKCDVLSTGRYNDRCRGVSGSMVYKYPDWV